MDGGGVVFFFDAIVVVVAVAVVVVVVGSGRLVWIGVVGSRTFSMQEHWTTCAAARVEWIGCLMVLWLVRWHHFGSVEGSPRCWRRVLESTDRFDSLT